MTDLAADLEMSADDVIISALVGGLVSALMSALPAVDVHRLSTVELGALSAALETVVALQPDTPTFAVALARIRHEFLCRDVSGWPSDLNQERTTNMQIPNEGER